MKIPSFITRNGVEQKIMYEVYEHWILKYHQMFWIYRHTSTLSYKRKKRYRYFCHFLPELAQTSFDSQSLRASPKIPVICINL